jgi:hypothetical protein
MLDSGQTVGTFGGFSVLKGHGFSRAAKTAKGIWALAPEGCFL